MEREQAPSPQERHLFTRIADKKRPRPARLRGVFFVCAVAYGRLRLLIKVPTPVSVKISSRIAFGTRPSMINELPTPP